MRGIQSCVSLDRGEEREEGVDDDRRREVSLMTLAMSGLAIVGMYTVTCCQSSWRGGGWDWWGRIRKGQRELG